MCFGYVMFGLKKIREEGERGWSYTKFLEIYWEKWTMICFGKAYIIRVSCEKIGKNKEEKCHTQVTCTKLKELPVASLVNDSTKDCRCIENLIKELAFIILKKQLSNDSLEG